jgi:hypothetical protein
MIFHRYKFFIKQTAVTALYANYLRFVKYSGAHHGADGRVHAGGVAARGQNPDFFD